METAREKGVASQDRSEGVGRAGGYLNVLLHRVGVKLYPTHVGGLVGMIVSIVGFPPLPFGAIRILSSKFLGDQNVA